MGTAPALGGVDSDSWTHVASGASMSSSSSSTAGVGEVGGHIVEHTDEVLLGQRGHGAEDEGAVGRDE